MNGKIRVRVRAKTSGEVRVHNNLMGRRSKSRLQLPGKTLNDDRQLAKDEKK